jgi:enoyl-[acyl-carrier protein] reductase II
MKSNTVSKLLHIQYPIIQAGMVWVSGGKLAAASSNAGILGVIGAGSMKPDLLKNHILKTLSLTDKPFAVNIPLLYKDAEAQLQTCLDLGVKIFITSAGSPKTFTEKLKQAGCTVIHVVSTPLLAKKCEDAGVDLVIAEGFEAGGHNGREELTTMTLIPQVVSAVKIPVIAAGGIADGRGILAALSLGAHGVQMGSRFVLTQESSAHENFKNALLKANFDSTDLVMKKHVPVRLLKNSFYQEVKKSEENCASKEELIELLGKGRAKLGMLDGDLTDGELEIGQIVSLIKDCPAVSELVLRLLAEYEQAKKSLL